MSDAPPSASVLLVDEHDRAIGEADKMAAHQPPGMLHRALSGFITDDAGRLLLQRRAPTKHHFAGRWSNSFCTHPRPDETPVAAGERRMIEELGITCPLEAVGSFTYRATDPVSGLVEHEFDHVLVGRTNEQPRPVRSEVDATRSLWVDELADDLAAHPDRYTPWLAPALAIALGHRSMAPTARTRAPEPRIEP